MEMELCGKAVAKGIEFLQNTDRSSSTCATGQTHCPTGHKSDRHARTVWCAFTIGPGGGKNARSIRVESSRVERRWSAGDRSSFRKIQFGIGQNESDRTSSRSTVRIEMSVL